MKKAELTYRGGVYVLSGDALINKQPPSGFDLVVGKSGKKKLVSNNDIDALMVYQYADKLANRQLLFWCERFYQEITTGFSLEDFEKCKSDRNNSMFIKMPELKKWIIRIQEALYFKGVSKQKPKYRKKRDVDSDAFSDPMEYLHFAQTGEIYGIDI